MKTNLFWPVVSRWLLVTGFFLAWVGSNRGQDVAVGMPEWFMAEPAPDTLPWLEPGFPSYLPWDLKTIGEPVYAICTRYSNPAGDDFLSSTHGSFLPFHRFVERELREHPMSYQLP